MNTYHITYKGATILESNIDDKITDAQSQIELVMPQEFCDNKSIAVFGIVSFGNKYTKTIQFVHIRDRIWRASLNIERDDLMYLANVYITLLISTFNNAMQTNDCKITLDIEAVNLSIRKIRDTDIADLKKDIATLKQTLNAIAQNYSLGIITPENTDYIKPGMVPMTIEGGKWIAQYPFANVLKSVNGIKSANGDITITPNEIIYDNGTLNDALITISQAIAAQSKLSKEITRQLKSITNKVAELDIKLNEITNKGLL